jgi:PTH1 family peptidyl-tRNA hydrolase
MVVCDDINLDFGTLRVKAKGSSGGHKGLLSIIEELDTDEFSRLRIGIRPSKKICNLEEFVLSDFTNSEKLELDKVMDNAIDCLKMWIEDGIDYTMNRFNRRRREVK